MKSEHDLSIRTAKAKQFIIYILDGWSIERSKRLAKIKRSEWELIKNTEEILEALTYAKAKLNLRWAGNEALPSHSNRRSVPQSEKT